MAVHLGQSSRDLLDGLVGPPVVQDAGFDWAQVWKQPGDLVTPFDMVLVIDGRSIGYLPGLDWVLDGSYVGELLDVESGQPLGVEQAVAQSWLDKL
jgi:hypothetical protein